MPVATSRTVALNGATGHLIDVQADVSQGVVMTTLVGRPDATLNEGRDRVRMAVANSGFTWPATRRVTILLSPADLHKRGSHFDLAIAVAVLGASCDAFPPGALRDTVFLGELSLEGGLRCVPGVLPMAMAAAQSGATRLMVPEPQAAEAALVPGLAVFGMRSLAQVIAELAGREVPEAAPVPEPASGRLLSWRGEDRADELDLADVIGLADARFAVEVAAAGGHHLLLSGPKGAGKTTLAERIPGLLPDLSGEEALELTAICSLAGTLDPAGGLVRRPPFFAPHHDASRTSLLGGGTGRVRPGMVSQAHGGVLLLDEFPLFHADVIDALRQPMESGEVTVARGEESATYPARGMLILACNPCPCGNYHPSPSKSRCDCREVQRRAYRRKVSGPITDRIDITRHLKPAAAHDRDDPLAEREPSHVVRSRVTAARTRQLERYAGRAWRLNAHTPGPALAAEFPVGGGAGRILDDAVYDGRLSRRGATRAHRLAWTLADLWGDDQPEELHVQVALALRLGEPVPSRALRLACGVAR